MPEPRLPLTPAERAALRNKAEQATPGPWAYEATNEKGNDWCLGVVLDANDQPMSGRVKHDEGTVDEQVAWGEGLHNAAYIAAISPDRLLALLDEVERLEARLENQKGKKRGK